MAALYNKLDMKNHNSRTPAMRQVRGFSLIELLIVIVIIAVLVSVGYTIQSQVRENARKAQATTLAAGIDTGISRFRDDYYRFPEVSGVTAGNDANRLASEGEIVVVLAGRETGSGSEIENRRKINYLDNMTETSDYTNGIQYSGDGSIPEGIYDPWSRATDRRTFLISWDGDGDGQITDPENNSRVLNRSVAVISEGRSGESGTPEANRDNVRSY